MPWHFRIDVRVKYGVRFAQKLYKSFQIKQIKKDKKI